MNEKSIHKPQNQESKEMIPDAVLENQEAPEFVLEEQDIPPDATLDTPELPSEENPGAPEAARESATPGSTPAKLLKQLETLQDPEAKLRCILSFMEASLVHQGAPQFKNFWGARSLCTPLFKEALSAAARNALWVQYLELSKEARRVKNLLDEQSAYAVEQIEMAIQAVEAELAQLDTEEGLIKNFEVFSRFLESERPFYSKIQGEIDLLNRCAARINALRKELMQTEMRIRKKNELFQRLSKLGDRVFPRRKERIVEVSQHFVDDVERFITNNFDAQAAREPFFALREEIKDLQSMAKQLTLNTQAFTKARVRLSECWDKVKKLDQERRQVRAQERQASQEIIDGITQQMDAVSQQFESGELSLEAANEACQKIAADLRNTRLYREEMKIVRQHFDTVQRPIIEKLREIEEAHEAKAREVLLQKQHRLEELKNEIAALCANAPAMDEETLTKTRDELVEKMAAASLSKNDRQVCELLFKPLREMITEKREQRLMSLPEDMRHALEQLREVLKQRKERRQEAKEQLEALRRVAGGSGLDFERAMEYTAQLQTEKERVEKLNQGIREIEQKISELEQS